MNEAMTLGLAGMIGMVLGALFFGGLWWTVRRGVSSQHPALWFLGSLLVRMSIATIGLYLVARGHWDRLLVCLLGFILARLAVTWWTNRSGVPLRPPPMEGIHAP